jgi:hypothetical protein
MSKTEHQKMWQREGQRRFPSDVQCNRNLQSIIMNKRTARKGYHKGEEGEEHIGVHSFSDLNQTHAPNLRNNQHRSESVRISPETCPVGRGVGDTSFLRSSGFCMAVGKGKACPLCKSGENDDDPPPNSKHQCLWRWRGWDQVELRDELFRHHCDRSWCPIPIPPPPFPFFPSNYRQGYLELPLGIGCRQNFPIKPMPSWRGERLWEELGICFATQE